MDGAGLVRRAEDLGEDRVVAERGHQEVAVVLAGLGVPVARPRGVGTVRDELVEHGAEGARARRAVPAKAPRQPVVRERDGRDLGGVVRLGVAQPAELGDGERRDGDEPRTGGEIRRAKLLDEVRGGSRGTGVVPQERVTDHVAVGVEGDHPVLLSAHGDGVDVRDAAGIRDRLLYGVPPRGGIDRGAVRVRRATQANLGARREIPDDDLATLSGRVHPCDESHDSSLSLRGRG